MGLIYIIVNGLGTLWASTQAIQSDCPEYPWECAVPSSFSVKATNRWNTLNADVRSCSSTSSALTDSLLSEGLLCFHEISIYLWCSVVCRFYSLSCMFFYVFSLTLCSGWGLGLRSHIALCWVWGCDWNAAPGHVVILVTFWSIVQSHSIICVCL